MRLNRYVASSTTLSRRAADDAIATGRVMVGERAGQLGDQVEDEIVTLDGAVISPRTSHTYLMLNKPAGYVVSRSQQGSDPTIYELLAPELVHLNPIGRLDKDSSGLLLLTDDGELAHRAGHPSFGKLKRYELELDRALSDDDAIKLGAGVELDDGLSRPKLIAHGDAKLTLSLEEGRNRQLRRTMSALGYEVVRLHRTSFGPYELGDLAEGTTAPFEPEALA